MQFVAVAWLHYLLLDQVCIQDTNDIHVSLQPKQ